MDKFHAATARAADWVRRAGAAVPPALSEWVLGVGSGPPLYRVTLVTGDKRGAGTDANVFLIVHDATESSRTIGTNGALANDHERGSLTHKDVGEEAALGPGPFVSIDLWREDHFGSFWLPEAVRNLFFGGGDKSVSDWFVDRIELRALECPGECWVFPVHRWIRHGPRYRIPLYDCLLPQHDALREQFRRSELQVKKGDYQFVQKASGGPVQIKNLPPDERFSERFFLTFFKKRTKLLTSQRIINWMSSTWNSVEDLKEIYKFDFQPPASIGVWKEDWWFGLQRIQGIDSTILRLCESVPKDVDIPDDIEKLLDGNTLADTLKQRKMFVCSLSVLQDLPCKDQREVASPIALFYLNSRNQLLPILIQLRQEKSSLNPVYTPLDSPNTWLLAKMYYNNAEAQYHQALTHLGLTHLLMEGVCGAVHRCLSVSHPMFRLLAPHFLFVIAINKRGEEKLINEGGWVDSTMTQGTKGMFNLMARGFQHWNFMKTDPRWEIGDRGLLDAHVMSYYPYRDDSISFYTTIRTYVTKIVERYYVSDDVVAKDDEINSFRRELSAACPDGIGLKGVPGCPERGFSNVEEIIVTMTGIISTCSIGHAAANSQQYLQYAFVPNYPGMLTQNPPTEKKSYTDDDIMSLLPSKSAILDTMLITELLSTPITKRLGDFEVQYMFHPEDVRAADELRKDLENLSEEIGRRNKSRKLPYEDLDPKVVPNSISV